MLSKEKIERALPDIPIVVYETVDSTNSEAKRLAMDGASLPLLICADSQSAGRGRLGRSFYSPEGTGLYMSFCFEAEEKMADELTITSAAAVAVCHAIEELLCCDCRIKWVNDIYLGTRKVCGILTEAMSVAGRTVIIVGIGVNCTTEAFPEDIVDRAGSVGITEREKLASAIVKKLLSYRAQLTHRTWISEYRRRSLALGERISYTERGVTRTAIAVDIDRNGGLIIEENGQRKTLSTGEITLRIY